MSGAGSHAVREMEILSSSVPDAVILEFRNEIIALCDKFGGSGQSGGSAPLVASAISQAVKKLMLFETVAPLTGEDDEWEEVTSMNNGIPMFQNKRDSRVFKGGDGRAHFIEAMVFEGDRGGAFTGGGVLLSDGSKIGSSQYVKAFPFKPKTFYVNVIDYRFDKKDGVLVESENGDWWGHTVKDESQLVEVFKYYDRFSAR